jgi:hypothetical protein
MTFKTKTNRLIRLVQKHFLHFSVLWQDEGLQVPRPLDADVQQGLGRRVAELDLYLSRFHCQPHHRVEAGRKVVQVVRVVDRRPRAERGWGGRVLEHSGVAGYGFSADG